MPTDINITIGGEAGQGIQTIGSLIAQVCHRAGLYVLAVNHFESRIRGGHSAIQIRIGDRPIRAPRHRIDLLVAMNAETYPLHRDEMAPGGTVILGMGGEAGDGNVVHIPFEGLARDAGGRITANTVAAGACLATLGAPREMLDGVLEWLFGEKKKDALAMNLAAAELGYRAVETPAFENVFSGSTGERRGRLLEGAEAVALGALAADCRFSAFYPMSPGTGVMTHLAGHMGKFPLVVEQAEDEIAAVNMIIGAAFAGVRAMTSTSGGGFCLMAEGLGLSAITETPIVIVNAQRPGPATGLPTRTAQADLMFMVHASQDEFPRFVFAPRDGAEAYSVTARAFDLAEKYQVPAIVMVDQYLCDSWFVVESSLDPAAPVTTHTVTDAQMDDPAEYRRFEITPSGVSPRALPCRGKALVMACSDEHTEDGHITEDAEERVRMVDKRNAKLPDMAAEMRPPAVHHGDSKILLVGWGSTHGAIQEAVDILRADGHDVGSVTFADLWPFPAAAVTPILERAERLVMVEQNTTAQLGRLIRMETGIDHAGAVLKYDGRPLYPNDIVSGVAPHVR